MKSKINGYNREAMLFDQATVNKTSAGSQTHFRFSKVNLSH